MPEARENTSRACIVAQEVYTAGGDVAREAAALRDDGFEVHVVCARGDGEAALDSINGVQVHRVAQTRAGPDGDFWRYALDANVFYVLAKFALLRLHFSLRFDVVQVNNPPDALAIAALATRLYGARVVLRVREPAPERFAERFEGRWYAGAVVLLMRVLRRLALACANRVVATGRELREMCARAGADLNDVTAVVEVPDDEAFGPGARERHRATIASVKKEERRRGAFRVFYRGPLDRAGGVDTLLRAAARLRDDVPEVELRISGVGEPSAGVAALAAELGLSSCVHWVGDVSAEAMAEEVVTADVAVVPAPRSPVASVVLPREVFAYASLGCAVVASRLPALTSYFGDDAFFYFAPGDPDDLAGKLYAVFAHPEDLATRVAAAAKIMETYRWERERKKYIGVFHKLLAPGGVSGA